MSGRALQPYKPPEGKSRASMESYSYQSIWMGRWTRTSFNTTVEPPNHISNHIGIQEVHQDSKHQHLMTGLEISSNISKSANQSLKMSPIATSNERSICKYSAADDDMQSLRPQIGYDFAGSTSRSYRFDQEKGGFDHGRKATSSFSDRIDLVSKKPLSNINLRIPEQQHSNNLPYSPQRFPYPGHDIDSQTSRNLLITGKDDVNVSKEHEFFRQPRVLSDSDRTTMSRDVYPFISRGERQLKLQSLFSSTDDEDDGNIEASKAALMHESSAETNTMDMDSFKVKGELAFGSNSTLSSKAINKDLKLPVGINEVLLNNELPDMNELPALPAAASSSNNTRPTSSRTQSLDMDVLLEHAQQPSTQHPSTSKHIISPDDTPKIDPTTRWIKRLKVNNASHSYARGMKSSDIVQNPSHEQAKKLHGKVLTSNPNGEKNLTASDKIGELPRKEDSSYMDLSKEGKKLLFSNPWIQRWLRKGNGSRQKKPKAVVVCEPQCSNLTLEDLEKKQFPSIAAMALMGKAINCFEPCELRNRGSSVTWNTRTF